MARMNQFACFAFVGVILLLGAASVRAQFGPPSGGNGRFGGGPPDPGRIFDFIARGKDHIEISQLRRGRDQVEAWAKQNGISNGKLTRDQFSKYFQSRMKEKEQGSLQTSSEKKEERKESDSGSDRIKRMADWYFRRRDRNRDGQLNRDEMSDTLRGRYRDFDKNRDGLISREAAGEYIKAWSKGQIRRNTGSDRTNVTTIVVDEDPRPIVFRVGKLPSNLPDWFEETDKDLDGQVGLYEWRKTEKPFDEFVGMDRNDDGFLTAEEVLFHKEYGESDNQGQVTRSPSSNSSGGSTRGSFFSRFRKGRGR